MACDDNDMKFSFDEEVNIYHMEDHEEDEVTHILLIMIYFSFARN